MKHEFSNFGATDSWNSEKFGLSCQTEEARYHVWVAQKDGKWAVVHDFVSRRRRHLILYKNSLEKREGPGYFTTRYLDATAKANKEIVDALLSRADELIAAAKAKAEAAEQERLAKAAADYKVHLAKEAGPYLLAALKALVAQAVVSMTSDHGHLIDDAYAAIAKAEGRGESHEVAPTS